MKEVGNRIWIEEPRGFIYFIQMDSIGPIKIGFTNKVKNRLISLQTANPYSLKLIYHYPSNEEDEAEWHRCYEDVRLQGEWFLPHPKLLENIKNHKHTNLLSAEQNRIFKSFQNEWEKYDIEKYWKDCPLIYQAWRQQMDEAKKKFKLIQGSKFIWGSE